jgi:diaminopimelate decarboxylase
VNILSSDCFTYREGRLYAEDVPVDGLADEYGTPLYIYSRAHFERRYRALREALADLDPIILFSAKTNTNGAVLKTFLDLGAGVDVVSGGELERARRAGCPGERIAFAGVGKTVQEIDLALREGILFFTVESEPELDRIAERARRAGARARIAIRVNPNVDPKTHKYTTTGKRENKFGVDLERAAAAFERAAGLDGLEIAGLHMHLGSPLSDERPYVEAVEAVAPLCRSLQSLYPTFGHIDIGGGLGIRYRPDDAAFDLGRFASALTPRLKELGLRVSLEPGRWLAGNGGILVGRVQYVKDNPFKKFAIVDMAMNDLIRPPLYQAYHHIQPVRETAETLIGDVVGPVCESGDFMAQDRELPAVSEGDLLAVMSAGAYGFAMASNYNSRGRAAEVLVEGDHARLVRRRETIDDLLRLEREVP